MREIELFQQLQLVASADSPRSGAPFTDAVESEDGGFGERAREKGAGCVAFMVFEEHQFGAMSLVKCPADRAGLMQFFLQPERNCPEEAAKSEGGEGEVCFEQSIEFGEWFFVEGGDTKDCGD